VAVGVALERTVAVERVVVIAVALAVGAVVVEMAVEVARSVAVVVDRAFSTAAAAVEGTGNNQPNLSSLSLLLLSLSVVLMHRRRHCSSRAAPSPAC
jgi:hypothetical protein